MLRFVGEYTAKLDDKGRLIFPSALKEQASPNVDGEFIVKKNIHRKCLEIYPVEEWTRISDELYDSLDMLDPEDDEFWDEYNKYKAAFTPDEKTGRILIPKKLLEMINVEKEVVFVGLGRIIKLWAKEAYERSQMSTEKYAEVTRKVKEKREKRK
ncbi:MAG: hypothetical protein LBL90_03165 [Prevotellaceae bacterium]|jgi:MraZ protein|nr:hypothetical protein [Prevotellaceae bacterium]